MEDTLLSLRDGCGISDPGPDIPLMVDFPKDEGLIMIKNAFPTFEANILTYSELKEQGELEGSVLKNRFKYTVGKIKIQIKSKPDNELETASTQLFSKRVIALKRLLALPRSLNETFEEISSLVSSKDPKLSAPKPLSGLTLSHMKNWRDSYNKTLAALPGMDSPFKVTSLVSAGPTDPNHLLLDLIASVGSLVGTYPVRLGEKLDLTDRNIIHDLNAVYNWKSSFDFAVLESLSELASCIHPQIGETSLDVGRFCQSWELMIEDYLLKNFSNFEAATKQYGISINTAEKLSMIAKNLNHFHTLLISAQDSQNGADRKRKGNYIITVEGRVTSKCPEQIIQDAVNKLTNLSEKDKKKIADSAWDLLFSESGQNIRRSNSIISAAIFKLSLFYKDPVEAFKRHPKLLLFNNTNTAESVRILDTNIRLQEQIAIGVVENTLLEEHLTQSNNPKNTTFENAWKEFFNDNSDVGVAKKQVAAKIYKRLNFPKIASGKTFTNPMMIVEAAQAARKYSEDKTSILTCLSKWRGQNILADESFWLKKPATYFELSLRGEIEDSHWTCFDLELGITSTNILLSGHQRLTPLPLSDTSDIYKQNLNLIFFI